MRMGVEVPEAAKMVLLQEHKFKSYYNKLSFALEQYEEVVDKIMPITATLLKPHLAAAAAAAAVLVVGRVVLTRGRCHKFGS